MKEVIMAINNPIPPPIPDQIILNQIHDFLRGSRTLDGRVRESKDRVSWLKKFQRIPGLVHGLKGIVGTDTTGSHFQGFCETRDSIEVHFDSQAKNEVVILYFFSRTSYERVVFGTKLFDRFLDPVCIPGHDRCHTSLRFIPVFDCCPDQCPQGLVVVGRVSQGINSGITIKSEQTSRGSMIARAFGGNFVANREATASPPAPPPTTTNLKDDMDRVWLECRVHSMQVENIDFVIIFFDTWPMLHLRILRKSRGLNGDINRSFNSLLE